MRQLTSLARRASLAALLSASSLAAQQPVPAQTGARAASSAGRPLLWSLTKGETTVYLLGSMHALTPDVYPLPARIDSAFADAERVVFEVNLDSMQSRAMEVLTLATIEQGRTLKDVLTPETYALLDRTLPGLGVPVERVQRFEPWFIGIMLGQITMQRAGFSPQHGIDMHLNGRAKEAGKPTGGLESVDFQLRLFDSVPLADQDVQLRNALAEMDTAAKVLHAMKSAWHAGEADEMARLIDRAMAKQPAMRSVFLVDRNRRWVPQIEGMLQGREDVLVVVGAAHLVGKESVIELLRERGYTVNRP